MNPEHMILGRLTLKSLMASGSACGWSTVHTGFAKNVTYAVTLHSIDRDPPMHESRFYGTDQVCGIMCAVHWAAYKREGRMKHTYTV